MEQIPYINWIELDKRDNNSIYKDYSILQQPS